MGPSVKFVLAIIDSIFKKQNGDFFSVRKVGHEGGGVRGLRVRCHKKYLFNFLNISLTRDNIANVDLSCYYVAPANALAHAMVIC